VFLSSAGWSQTACFTETDSASGPNPERIAVGDFNSDGKLDAVQLGSASSRIMVSLMGLGEGHLLKQAKYISILPRDVAVGDMNGDGKLDAVVANEVPLLGAGQVKVFLGNGDGTFRIGTIAQVSNNVERVALADVNHDGKLDAVIETGVFTGPDLVQVLLGNGDGTLQSPVVVYTLPNYPQALAVADLNSDGNPDVLALTSNANDSALAVSVLLGKGDGTFQAGVQYSTVQGNTSSLVTGDYNQDGNTDVALAAGGSFVIFFGTGGGVLGAPVTIPSATGVGVSIAAADLTGSGRQDLIGIGGNNQGKSAVVVLFNSGGGTFLTPQIIPVHNAPLQIVSGDFNGDGKPDLALAYFTETDLGVLLNCSTPAG
jgi:hypothetical protein